MDSCANPAIGATRVQMRSSQERIRSVRVVVTPRRRGVDDDDEKVAYGSEHGGGNESRPNIDEDHTAADRCRSCPVRVRGGARGVRLRWIRLRLGWWLGS